MKKLLKLIALLLLVNTALQGQYTPLVEEGKFWIYVNYENSDFPSTRSGHAITFLGDTTINALTYKKVYRLHLKGSHNCPPEEWPCWNADLPYQSESKQVISYIREDTTLKQVYNLPIINNSPCSDDEILLFDFSLQVGDTVNCSVYESIWASSANQYPAGIVDSIKIIEVEGKLRRALITHGFYTTNGLPFEIPIPIAEGFGYSDFGLFYEPLVGLTDYCEGQIDPCNLILSNSAVSPAQQINIFPNPSSGIFQVNLERENIKSIKAYSILGQLQKETQFENTIDLSTLASGVYLLEILSANDKRYLSKINKLN